ncbi:hypothetical protein [Algihabitans albus]|uniref:hypothetical protein n=1 Tax=Algihabitans albus TaxID=2164067 RepID=UPI0013C3158A|nr:hypothetical protein [Algihabitans albus]
MSDQEFAIEYFRQIFGLNWESEPQSHAAGLFTYGSNRLQAQVRLLAESLPERTLFEVSPSEHASLMAADESDGTTS